MPYKVGVVNTQHAVVITCFLGHLIDSRVMETAEFGVATAYFDCTGSHRENFDFIVSSIPGAMNPNLAFRILWQTGFRIEIFLPSKSAPQSFRGCSINVGDRNSVANSYFLQFTDGVLMCAAITDAKTDILGNNDAIFI